MQLSVRLTIKKNEVFLNPDAREILEAIDKTKSISGACREVGVSYPKALKLIQTIEKELGFLAVYSQKGGANKGGSVLTEEGRELLESYKSIEEDVNSYAQQIFKERFNYK